MSAVCENSGHSPNEHGQCDDCRGWVKPHTPLGLFIEMSTGHVTESTMQLLNDDGADCNAWSNEFGVFVSTAVIAGGDADYIARLPPDLYDVTSYAHSKGARYVLLDRDAENIDGLPVYDW